MSETLSRELMDLSAGALAAAIAKGEASALEACDAAIARIEARDGAINAVVVRDFERARSAARAVDAGGVTGPLAGVPMTVKESFNVAGLPSTWGSPAFSGWTADEDAVAVARLKAAGAVVLGKTNVPPFLADWQANNPVYGRTNNPHDLSRTPGGSSGGSAAALAAGMVPLELGSDIGGSIRVPAAFCGVFGHKPSWNLIPVRGHQPPGLPAGAPMPLAVVGPMARTAGDLAIALDALAGPDEGEAVGYRALLPPPRHARLADYRVLVLDRHPVTPTSGEIVAAVNDLAARLDAGGADLVRTSERLPDLAGLTQIYGGLLDVLMTRGSPAPSTALAHDYLGLLDAQAAVRRQFAALFADVDVVVCPAYGVTAFEHVQREPMSGGDMLVDGTPTPIMAQMGWQSPALLGCLPSTVAPIGRGEGGLPIGVQVIGGYLEDRTTIAFAGLLEREFGGYIAPKGL